MVHDTAYMNYIRTQHVLGFRCALSNTDKRGARLENARRSPKAGIMCDCVPTVPPCKEENAIDAWIRARAAIKDITLTLPILHPVSNRSLGPTGAPKTLRG